MGTEFFYADGQMDKQTCQSHYLLFIICQCTYKGYNILKNSTNLPCYCLTIPYGRVNFCTTLSIYKSSLPLSISNSLKVLILYTTTFSMLKLCKTNIPPMNKRFFSNKNYLSSLLRSYILFKFFNWLDNLLLCILLHPRYFEH